MDDVELEADRNGGKQHDAEPLPQFRQTTIFELLAVEEEDERRNHKAHILMESLLVGKLYDITEAATILHHAEIVFARELQMFCDG